MHNEHYLIQICDVRPTIQPFITILVTCKGYRTVLGGLLASKTNRAEKMYVVAAQG